MFDKCRIEIIVVLYGKILARTYSDQCFEQNEVKGHMATIAMDELRYSIERAAETKEICGKLLYEDLPSIHFDPLGIIVKKNENQYFVYRIREAMGM